MFTLSFARIMYGSNQQSRASNPVHHDALWAEPARLEFRIGLANTLWQKQAGAEKWLRKVTTVWLSKVTSIFRQNL